MLVLQLSGGIAIFLRHVLRGDFPPDRAFAALLGYLILVAAGFAFARKGARAALVALKCLFCLLLLRPYAPYALFLLPALALELPGLFAPERRLFPLWAFLGLLAALPALFIPTEDVPLYLVAWSVPAIACVSGLRRGILSARSALRARDLEKRLAESEARRDSLEEARAGTELRSKLEERDRIAQGLHDDLGHAMTGSIMQLEAASAVFPDDPARAMEIVGKTKEVLREGLASVRASLRSLKPAAALLGSSRVEAELRSFQADHGIETSFSVEGGVELVPERVWRAVEGNLKEALTNTLRQGSARRFSLSLRVLNGMYKAEFRDDGAAAPGFRKGMGLEGMEARTREAGGTMIVDASRGFSVIMLFMKGEKDHGHPDHHRG